MKIGSDNGHSLFCLRSNCMPTISTKDFVVDKANGADHHVALPHHRPAWALLEKRLLNRIPAEHVAEPPAGSGLKPVVGDAGLPILGHMVEMLRGGPDFLVFLYRTRGPLVLVTRRFLPGVAALGPDATQAVYSNRNKDFSQRAGPGSSARSSTGA